MYTDVYVCSEWDTSNEDVFVVRSIINYQVCHQEDKFAVQWEAGDVTWEPRENLVGCNAELNKFEKKHVAAMKWCKKHPQKTVKQYYKTLRHRH